MWLLVDNSIIEGGKCPPQLDPDGYYVDINDCIDYLTQITYGTYDQSFSNTTVCRILHTLLTVFDPGHHCPHSGKSGGGKCIDVPYSDYYLTDY